MRVIDIDIDNDINNSCSDIHELIDFKERKLFEKLNNRDAVDYHNNKISEIRKKISEIRKEDIIDYIIINYSPKFTYEKEINYLFENIYCIITFYNEEGDSDKYYIYEKEMDIYPANATIIDKKVMVREILINKILQ
jgi:hypothetical protein